MEPSDRLKPTNEVKLTYIPTKKFGERVTTHPTQISYSAVNSTLRTNYRTNNPLKTSITQPRID